MTKRIVSFVLFPALLAVALGLVGCAPKAQPAAPPLPSASTTAPALSGVDLGKQIFTTGIGASGKHVPYTEGMAMGPSGIGGCADCHGPDGRGMASMNAPPITYSALRKPIGKKPPMYASDEALKQPIMKGLDEDSKPLSKNMPRWQLSDQEFQSLVAYLKVLDTLPAAPAASSGMGNMSGMKGMKGMKGMGGMGQGAAATAGASGASNGAVPPPPP